MQDVRPTVADTAKTPRFAESGSFSSTDGFRTRSWRLQIWRKKNECQDGLVFRDGHPDTVRYTGRAIKLNSTDCTVSPQISNPFIDFLHAHASKRHHPGKGL